MTEKLYHIISFLPLKPYSVSFVIMRTVVPQASLYLLMHLTVMIYITKTPTVSVPLCVSLEI